MSLASQILEPSRPAQGFEAQPDWHQAAFQQIHVLKFGGSVITGNESFARVAGEIYRHHRQGHKCVVVVSAPLGWTDRLFDAAKVAEGGSGAVGTADVVSLGEAFSCAMLKLACGRIGLQPCVADEAAIGLKAVGGELDADPIALVTNALLSMIGAHDVVIVPGFVGIRDDRTKALLGRGGTDTTAVFIAGEIAADALHLYKDVDGVFEKDPAIFPQARKFIKVSWKDAERVADQLIHNKAIEYARKRQLSIKVGAIGGSDPTTVSTRTVRLPSEYVKDRKTRIALAGYGTVGQELARLIEQEPSLEVSAVLVANAEKPREFPYPVTPSENVGEFLDCDADIFVDALSCDQTAGGIARAALAKGCDLVSASKRLIQKTLPELIAIKDKHGGALRYSPAVGGAMPVLEAIDQFRAGSIEKVGGILNGTTNTILDSLHSGIGLETAIKKAVDAGFAEADCSFDLEGYDAISKLGIIAHHAFGVKPNSIKTSTEPLISKTADRIQESSKRHYQWASLERIGQDLVGTVRLLPEDEIRLSCRLSGEWNCAEIHSRGGQVTTVRGRGAGGHPTAQAMLADILELSYRSSGRECGIIS